MHGESIREYVLQISVPSARLIFADHLPEADSQPRSASDDL